MGYYSPWLEWIEILIKEKDNFIAARKEFEQMWSNAKCKWFLPQWRQYLLWGKMMKKYEIPEYLQRIYTTK